MRFFVFEFGDEIFVRVPDRVFLPPDGASARLRDLAVYRSGIWYLQQSTNGFAGRHSERAATHLFRIPTSLRNLGFPSSKRMVRH